jgi:hypothetical protein
MSFFSDMFPKASYILTGCGFPDCGAHSANENLDLEFCRKLTTALSLTLASL